MTTQVASLRTVAEPDGQRYHMLYMWCPGCDNSHAVWLPGPDGYRPRVCWEWDGNLDAPTISPSLLVNGGHPGLPRCHSFIRAGSWQFLGDCDHDLKGQTVPMVPIPDWMARED